MRILKILIICLAATFVSGLQAQVRYTGWYNNPFYRLHDSIFQLKNGVLYFAFKDSLGTPVDTSSLSTRIDARIKYSEIKTINGNSLIGSSDLSISEVNFVSITSDVPTTSTSFVDVTSLSFPVTSGDSYWFRFIITYSSGSSGRGSAWAINGPSLTAVAYRSEWSGSTGRTTADGLSAYDATTANTGAAATTANMAIIEGVITCSASGNVIARMLSANSGNTITAKSHSTVQYKKL